jgi:hypothetical protein
MRDLPESEHTRVELNQAGKQYAKKCFFDEPICVIVANRECFEYLPLRALRQGIKCPKKALYWKDFLKCVH